MLLDNKRRSKGRVWGGTAAMGAIGLAALGLTASGTHAAETVRTTVEDRIGVKLDDVRLPSLAPLVAQDVPAPPAPIATSEPRAPEAPAEPGAGTESDSTPADGPQRHSRKIIIRSADGMDPAELERILAHAERSRIDGEKLAADIQKQLRFVTAKCGPGEGTTRTSETEDADGKRVTVICTDRIERMAADASERGARARVLAMSSARMGTDMARMSLRSARRAIEIDRNLSAQQRAQALAGVDQAMAELDAKRND